MKSRKAKIVGLSRKGDQFHIFRDIVYITNKDYPPRFLCTKTGKLKEINFGDLPKSLKFKPYARVFFSK